MAKLTLHLLLWLVWASSVQAKTLKLELYAQADLPEKSEKISETVGGLSALFWDGSQINAVCDDRGKFGPGRFYGIHFKLSPAKTSTKTLGEKSPKVEFEVREVQQLKNIPKGWILDLEGLASLPNGDLLLSTEGDHNKKPRALPQIFLASKDGLFKSAVTLPDKFVPESTGLQKKGVENNRGFEGLTVDPTGQSFFIMNEYPIIADQGKTDSEFWLRLVEFSKDPKSDRFEVKAEYPYKVIRSGKIEKSLELFRGVSEILFYTNNKMIILERGARFTKKGFAYTGGLYLADLTGAQDVSGVASLADGKRAPLNKELLVDFEELLKGQKVENFEGLAWGPELPSGRKSLLVLSDNNFSSREKTKLLVFSVNEVE